MKTNPEPWMLVGTVDPGAEEEMDGVIFIGSEEACRKKLEEEIIKETYPNIYLTKVVESAELSWDLQQYQEPPSVGDADVLSREAA